MDSKDGNAGQKTADEAPLFGAFISYSHADAAKVRKLHSQIEAYSLPKGLGAIDALNQKQRKLGKVFHDREDLPAAQDLSVAVTNALDRSNVLLVACSPAARASRWVDQEIAYFKERYPERPILAAILSGEPAEAFPRTLTEGGVEPLAADLRKEGDGWRLGFLKLVAGIAGVPLDTLIERDARRKMRRVMAVTGMVTLIAIAMAVMTAIALQARNEAQFQRNQADGLVAYMMEELRDELKGVGRIDVMEGVNEQALQYYSNHGDLSDLSPDSLEQRARILHAMGEDDELAGDLTAALEKFTEAHRATEELLNREPGNPDRIYAHAQSEYWVGFAAWRQIKPDIARPYWQNYADLSAQLLSFDETNADWVMEAGYGKSNLGTLALRGDGDNELAAQFFNEAIDFFEKAASLSPDNANIEVEIADALGWIADAQRAANAPQQALGSRLRQRELLDRLEAADPENAFFQSELISNAVGTAQALFELEDKAGARQQLLETQALVRGLTRSDPRNEKLQLQERVIMLLLARTDAGSSDTSKRTLRECIADSVVQGEAELRAFCAALRRDAGLTKEGGKAEEFTSPFPNMRLTPRWGLEI